MLKNNIFQDGYLHAETGASLFANGTNVNRLAALRFPS